MTVVTVTVVTVTVVTVTVVIVIVVIATVVILMEVIVIIIIVMVVIVTIFSKNNFNILTTEEIFEGQRFAILAMFFHVQCSDVKYNNLQSFEKQCRGRGRGKGMG